MSKKQNLPAMPFYWGDWFKAMDLQCLPRDVRCVWFEMLGRMWESNERGYLTVNGKPMENFAKSLLFGFGENVDEYLRYENILEQAGIFSRRESDGAIYCRKIVNDIELSKKRAEAGKKGGDKAKRFCLDFAQAKTQANSEDENENENEDISSERESAERERPRKRATTSTKFIPPTVEEVDAYAKQAGLQVDAQRFVDHFAVRGWIPKGYTRSMKDWRAAVRNWARSDYKPAPPKGGDAECKTHPLDAFFAAGISVDRIVAAIKDAGSKEKAAQIQQYMISKGPGVYRLYEQAIARIREARPQGAAGALVKNVARNLGGTDAKG